MNQEEAEKRKTIVLEAMVGNFNEVAAKYEVAIPTLRNWKSKLREDKDIMAAEQ